MFIISSSFSSEARHSSPFLQINFYLSLLSFFSFPHLSVKKVIINWPTCFTPKGESEFLILINCDHQSSFEPEQIFDIVLFFLHFCLSRSCFAFFFPLKNLWPAWTSIFCSMTIWATHSLRNFKIFETSIFAHSYQTKHHKWKYSNSYPSENTRQGEILKDKIWKKKNPANTAEMLIDICNNIPLSILFRSATNFFFEKIANGWTKGQQRPLRRLKKEDEDENTRWPIASKRRVLQRTMHATNACRCDDDRQNDEKWLKENENEWSFLSQMKSMRKIHQSNQRRQGRFWWKEKENELHEDGRGQVGRGRVERGHFESSRSYVLVSFMKAK